MRTWSSDYQHQISTLIYYSLITLATVGYGDIVPVTLPGVMCWRPWRRLPDNSISPS